MDGSDPKFNTVLMRSPSVFRVFSVQISRFLEEIYDFEQFSWAPVQDFSKKSAVSGALLMYLLTFPCFSRFDQVLEHCLWCFGISLMLFW